MNYQFSFVAYNKRYRFVKIASSSIVSNKTQLLNSCGTCFVFIMNKVFVNPSRNSIITTGCITYDKSKTFNICQTTTSQSAINLHHFIGISNDEQSTNSKVVKRSSNRICKIDTTSISSVICNNNTLCHLIRILNY